MPTSAQSGQDVRLWGRGAMGGICNSLFCGKRRGRPRDAATAATVAPTLASPLTLPYSRLFRLSAYRGGMLAASLTMLGWWCVDGTTCHRPNAGMHLLHGLLLSRLIWVIVIVELYEIKDITMCLCCIVWLDISSSGERVVTCTNCRERPPKF